MFEDLLRGLNLNKLDKQKLNFIIGVIVFVVLLDMVFVLRPLLKNVTLSFSQRKKIIQELNAFKRGGVSNLENKLAEFKKNIDEELLKLTSEKDIPKFLSWISEIAKEEKIKLMQMRPQGVAQSKKQTDPLADKYYLLPIELNLEGNYHQLGSFLNRLEQDKYFVKVKNLNIQANSKDYQRHTINLNLETFILKD